MIKFQDLARTRKNVSAVFLSLVPSPLYNFLSKISTFMNRKKILLHEYGDKTQALEHTIY